MIAHTKKSHPVSATPPPTSGSGVAKPTNQAMMMAIPMIDSTPVTSSPLYSARMMPLSGPRRTK